MFCIILPGLNASLKADSKIVVIPSPSTSGLEGYISFSDDKLFGWTLTLPVAPAPTDEEIIRTFGSSFKPEYSKLLLSIKINDICPYPLLL